MKETGGERRSMRVYRLAGMLCLASGATLYLAGQPNPASKGNRSDSHGARVLAELSGGSNSLNIRPLITNQALNNQAAQPANPPAGDLSGNWMVVAPNSGGMVRSYLNLKQEGSKITGTIRSTQFLYTIKESTGNVQGFTLTGAMMDAGKERAVVYEGKLVGDELHLGTRRRPELPLSESIAHKVPAGEGAYPARLPLPALHKVPDGGLAKTPPMGWNSWNKFHSRVDDATVREIADAIASNGMKDAGYVYVNIDDTWEGERDAKGNIQSNSKFPNMKALSDYIHNKGLKLGIYSSPGPNTCAGYEGSYAHEEQDARTYASWGIDYLKYDWCGVRNLYGDADQQAVYQKMGNALRASGRPIVYSLCQYGWADVWKWGPDVGGNLWRTTGDIGDRWDSMAKIGFGQSERAEWAAPGHWNDPDMLEIGNGGMTDAEYRTHMSLWAILAAPLVAGNDVRQMTPAIRDILLNKEVIAIDQDPAGKQGKRLSNSGDQEVWLRQLAGGPQVVGLFNRGTEEAKMKINWSDLGMKGTPRKVRDTWSHLDVKVEGPEYSVTVPGHSVVLLRVE